MRYWRTIGLAAAALMAFAACGSGKPASLQPGSHWTAGNGLQSSTSWRTTAIDALEEMSTRVTEIGSNASSLDASGTIESCRTAQAYISSWHDVESELPVALQDDWRTLVNDYDNMLTDCVDADFAATSVDMTGLTADTNALKADMTADPS